MKPIFVKEKPKTPKEGPSVTELLFIKSRYLWVASKRSGMKQ